MDWQFATFDSVETLMFEFEQVLQRYGISIHTDSALGRTCLTIMDIALKRGQTELLDPSHDPRLAFAYTLGLWPLMMKVVRLQDHPDFPQIVPHLREINTGSFAQNIAAEIRDMNDPTPAKMFELLIALAAMDIGTGLALDHPTKSKGDNPDVMVTIDGTRWAFACKVMSGKSPKTLFNRIEEGLSQIKRSAAERGCVVVNLKNRFDHGQFWPILNEHQYREFGAIPEFGAQTSLAAAVGQLRAIADKEVIAAVFPNQVAALFNDARLPPAVLLFLQTSMVITSPLGLLPATFPMLRVCSFSAETPHSRVFRKLHDALHNLVIRPETGTPGVRERPEFR